MTTPKLNKRILATLLWLLEKRKTGSNLHIAPSKEDLDEAWEWARARFLAMSKPRRRS